MNGPEEGVQSRDERIESYYHQSAWDLSEWIVDLEDEKERLGSAFAAHIRRGAAEWTAVRSVQLMNEAGRQRDRYRLAWLSARRRAAMESEYAAEALALKDRELSAARALAALDADGA